MYDIIYSGYVAPEYAINGHVSEKVDTYSFGVVVLEIISGRSCTEGIGNGSVVNNLVDYVSILKLYYIWHISFTWVHIS